VPLITRSSVARTVAAHVLGFGTQTSEPPEGLDIAAWKRALERLRKSGVLRRLEWEVDGKPYAPRSLTAGWLYLAGPRWDAYVEEAAVLGIAPRPLEETDW
jgi:hypothetical protein